MTNMENMESNEKAQLGTTRLNGEFILEQFADYAQRLAMEEGLATALTWGFEIESNTMSYVRDSMAKDGLSVAGLLEFQQDGSVSDHADTECECSCSDCSHSCDCDACEISDNDWFDHCGDCGGVQEVASIGGLSSTHPIGLRMLTQHGINNQTYDSDCGIHIHIGSQNFTNGQVANILTAYRLAQPIMDTLCERAGNNYAEMHGPDMENDARSGHQPNGKYWAVSTYWHYQNYRTKTIEFRGMGAESLSDIPQADRVRAWAHLLRALVMFATKPAPQLYWLSRAKDLNDLLRLINA
jgi:hypothetical protein